MALATDACCCALLPVTRAGPHLERSDMNRRSRLTSFQSTYSTPSVMSRLLFFARRALSLFFERRLGGHQKGSSDGSLPAGGSLLTLRPEPPPPPPLHPPPSPSLRRSFLLISAVAQRRLGPTVGDDLDDRAALAVLRLPRALLEATGDEHPGTLLERLADVLARSRQRGDVEEGGALLPLLVVAVLPAAADRHAEVGDGCAGGRETESGSRVRLPTMVTFDDMTASYLAACSTRPRTGGLAVGQAHDLVADGLVRESQRPLELVEVAASHNSQTT